MPTDFVAKTITFLRLRLTDYNATNRVGKGNWIFKGYPREDLSLQSFPRIAITKAGHVITPGGQRQGLWNAIGSVDIDIYAKRDVIFSVSGTKKDGQEICKQIATDIENVLKTYFVTDFYATYSDYSIDSSSEPEYQENMQSWLVSITLSLRYGETT